MKTLTLDDLCQLFPNDWKLAINTLFETKPKLVASVLENIEEANDALAGYAKSPTCVRDVLESIAAWFNEPGMEYDRTYLNPERRECIFRALELCSPYACKLVILGQDPQPLACANAFSDGLAFSSAYNDPSLSLCVIFDAIGRVCPWFRGPQEGEGGDLTLWAEQGVLLLNSLLTCGYEACSHADAGWQRLTALILLAAAECSGEAREGDPLPVWALGGVADGVALAVEETNPRSTNFNSNDIAVFSARHPAALSEDTEESLDDSLDGVMEWVGRRVLLNCWSDKTQDAVAENIARTKQVAARGAAKARAAAHARAKARDQRQWRAQAQRQRQVQAQVEVQGQGQVQARGTYSLYSKKRWVMQVQHDEVGFAAKRRYN